jgi:hypothetical protein
MNRVANTRQIGDPDRRHGGPSRRPARWVAALALGLALLRPVTAGQSLGGVNLLEVKPRILTPNGDTLNDVVQFKFDDTLAGRPLETEIMDIHGAKVANLSFAQNADATLEWNGKDSGGNALPSGIYIYSIQLGHHKATGTVVVAR